MRQHPVPFRKHPTDPDSDGLLALHGDQLWFTPYVFPSTAIKSLGFRWGQNGENAWVAPLTLERLYGVGRLFQNLTKDPSVEAYEESLFVPVPLPDEPRYRRLFPFQREAVSFLLAHRRCLLALAPGLGKTICAVLAASVTCQRTLVICPLSLVRNWRKEIAAWLGQEAAIWHQQVGAPSAWTIVNYETAISKEEELLKCDFDSVIVDESILVKNHTRKRLVGTDGKKRWQFTTRRVRAVYALTRDAERVWLLSGAPTSKFYDELWAQMHILDSRRFGSYWDFTERYCQTERNIWSSYGKVVIGNLPGASERIQKELADVYFARTQDQVLDLPDWIFDNYEVPMSANQYKMYRQMELEFLAELPAGDELLASNLLTQMVRLVQIASNPILIGGHNDSQKWQAVLELLQIEELPVILWTSFIETARSMSESLTKAGYRVGVLTGATPEATRQEIVDRYQVGDLDILVAHPAVGKFGHTLTAARTAIYLERNYNADDYYQSLHRIRRIGTTHSPHVIHLLSARPDEEAPTIDHVIDRVLTASRNSSLALTSGFVRSTLTGSPGGA